MPADDAGQELDPLEGARELIRSAAKWLIASLGGIGALLVAGSQLSSIGSLDPTDPRLGLALLGLALGLGSVLYAIWLVVGLLLPEKLTISELSERWQAIDRRSQPLGRHARDDVVAFFKANPEYLGGYSSIPAIQQAYTEAEPDADLGPILALMNQITSIAAFRSQRQRFLVMQRKLVLAVGIAAIGVGSFAWAANPEAKDQPPATLRGAHLGGTNLAGANLMNADLRGANLQGANLQGAQLRGAQIDGVNWREAICPDGVHSSAAGNSCEGHLTP